MAQNFRDGARYRLRARIAGVAPIVKFEASWPDVTKRMVAWVRDPPTAVSMC
jgi:hypothetical protein